MSAIREIALARAIGGSGGGSSVTVEPLSVDENGVYTAPAGTAYSPVSVAVSGGGVSRKDVNFYGYDGELVFAYTAAEFAEIEALPDNPEHTGLTAQGWNIPNDWALTDVKAYVAAVGGLDVSQMYITDDGKTRVYVHVDSATLNPILGIYHNGPVDVYWGDNTEHETLDGVSTSSPHWTNPHIYAAPNDYIIELTPSENGAIGFYGVSGGNQYSGIFRQSSSEVGGNRVYQAAVRKIEIGRGVTSIGQYAFMACVNLESVIIPKGVHTIATYAFNICTFLKYVSLPNSLTNINSYAFAECYNLKNMVIPLSVTSFATYAFDACGSLTGLTTNKAEISDYAFRGCRSIMQAHIRDGATQVGTYAFSGCFGLKKVDIPEGVNTIGNYAFQNCYNLESVTIPSTVTAINSSAFDGCFGLREIHFKRATPATAGSNAFRAVTDLCKIYVPTGSLSAYTSASNYPSSSTHQYIEE